MNLPVKPYIKNKLKTSYAVEGPETQYTIDCGDGVNVHTVSEKARQALQHLDHSLAQNYPHTVVMKESIQRYWQDIVPLPLIFRAWGPCHGHRTLLRGVCQRRGHVGGGI